MVKSSDNNYLHPAMATTFNVVCFFSVPLWECFYSRITWVPSLHLGESKKIDIIFTDISNSKRWNTKLSYSQHLNKIKRISHLPLMIFICHQGSHSPPSSPFKIILLIHKKKKNKVMKTSQWIIHTRFSYKICNNKTSFQHLPHTATTNFININNETYRIQQKTQDRNFSFTIFTFPRSLNETTQKTMPSMNESGGRYAWN